MFNTWVFLIITNVEDLYTIDEYITYFPTLLLTYFNYIIHFTSNRFQEQSNKWQKYCDRNIVKTEENFVSLIKIVWSMFFNGKIKMQ